MPRLPRLSGLAVALCLAVGTEAAAQTSSHFRSGNLTRPCLACHRGHGVSGSPLLAKGGDVPCIACHDIAARSQEKKAALGMGPGANPQDVRSDLLKPYTHKMARCLDCHSAHLAIQATVAGTGSGPASGLRKTSPKPGFSSEADLCLSCHGSRGARGADLRDLRARFDPTNPSFHPVLAAGRSTAVPSLRSPLTVSSLVNCTDCHASDSETGARGPHGSQNASLLRKSYSKADNQPESPATYGLCYECHDRETVLKRDDFPLHDKHVTGEKAACRICHDAHGSTGARALIRFNEAAVLTEVAPSRSGKIAFASAGPGTGACWLTCHGKNHDPLGYGAGSTLDGVALVTSGAPRPVPAFSPGPGGTKALAPSPEQSRPVGPVGDRGVPRIRDPKPQSSPGPE